MLRQLHITGLGVIDELDVEPAAGLTVLTGETGAGKTMIATGISLATGARGGAHLVREGARAAMVQARFDAPDGAEEWAEDGEVILARSIAADGRGSARIGGQLATAAALGEMGARLAEIHGQHGSLRLLDGATQTTFLDRAAGPQQVHRAGRVPRGVRAAARAPPRARRVGRRGPRPRASSRPPGLPGARDRGRRSAPGRDARARGRGGSAGPRRAAPRPGGGSERGARR